MKKFCLALFFFWTCFLGNAAAFPGSPFQEYFLSYGTPTNQKGAPQGNHFKGKIQYYWEGVEADPLSVGKKIKGTLIVLFEQRKTDIWSLQETFLAGVSTPEFKEVLEEVQKKWQTVSKTPHQNSNRSYDLYQIVSRDGRFSGEMSYSSPESIFSFQNHSAFSHQIPFLNLWIHLTPR